MLGLARHVVSFCKKKGIETKIINEYGTARKSLIDSVDQFLDDLELNNFELYTHQTEALKYIAVKNRGLILSPTSSGKSLIQYIMTRFFNQLCEVKCIIVVPRIDLVMQMQRDFTEYSNPEWISQNITLMGDGNIPDPDKPILITTWQSLHTKDQSFFDNYGALLTDEVHGADCDSQLSIIAKASHIQYRVGFTGTLKESKTSELQLIGAYGDVFKTKTTRQLIDAGQATDVKVEIVKLKYKDKTVKRAIRAISNKSTGYRQCIKYINSYEPRNSLIIDIALKVKNNTLILINFIGTHGNIIYKMLNDRIEQEGLDKKVYYIHGNISTAERNQIKSELETIDNGILIASYGTSSTGMSIKNLHNLILAHPVKSNVAVLQPIGRVIRLNFNKKIATVYDLADQLPFLSDHALLRQETYVSEQFKYSVHEREI